jgi:phage shock protein A
MPFTPLQNELDRLRQEREALKERERELETRMEELAAEIDRIKFKVRTETAAPAETVPV